MIHIVCFGNLWQGDDGFGIHVLRRLNQLDLPRHVRVFEAGISGLSALEYFENTHKVIVVDAFEAGLPAGSVRKFPAGERWLPGREFSGHAVGVDQLLALLPVVLEAAKLPE